MARPDPVWLVRDVLPEGGLVTLYGQSGGGKTFVALDLALRIATGMNWWGKRSVQQGLVAYIAGEGVGGLKNRIRAWLKDHDELGATTLDDSFFLLDTVPPLLNPMALRGLVEAVAVLPAMQAVQLGQAGGKLSRNRHRQGTRCRGRARTLWQEDWKSLLCQSH